MATTPATPWLKLPSARPQASTRLFCFPQAGGGASVFYRWHEGVPSGVEICAIQPPGRENRIGEDPFVRLEPLVEELTDALIPYLDKPFAFFGHSLGGWVGFEVARSLRRRQAPTPIYLFVSGCSAPHVPHRHPPIHELPDDQFLEALIRLDGIPEVALEHPELIELVLPTLRADFAVYETYAYTPERPLDCPISAFGGLQDPRVSKDELAAWNEQTNLAFSIQMLPGDHFFVNSTWHDLLETAWRDLSPLVCTPRDR